MVVHGIVQPLLTHVLLAQEPTKSPLEQLDPRHRAIVIIDIFLIVLIGLMLVAVVMTGAHWVRALARQNPGSGKRTDDSTNLLTSSRLRRSLAEIAPKSDTGATVQIDASTDETKIDRTDRKRN